ncbi:hypothetical protein [Dietzia alimentaria]|uniref:hypothetical protein n=1 Tax=Dietzia alimentaria TaxID=665550 RepID=UPI000299FB1E|nr:hypothetical protein [Dietzia alimentaria]
MIYLKRSGSGFTVGNGDVGYLTDVACRALDRGETVELHIDGKPWRPVTSPDEVRETLEELYDELDARRDALCDLSQLPIEDLL